MSVCKDLSTGLRIVGTLLLGLGCGVSCGVGCGVGRGFLALVLPSLLLLDLDSDSDSEIVSLLRANRLDRLSESGVVRSAVGGGSCLIFTVSTGMVFRD